MTPDQSADAPPSHLDRSLIAALIGNFVIRLDGGMVGMLLTLYLAAIDQRGITVVSATTVGLLSSAYYIVELALSPFMGAKSDDHGNRKLLLVGPIVGILAALVGSICLLLELTNSTGLALGGISVFLIALGITRLLQGLAAATSIPSILSFLSAHTEGSLELRGRVMSIFEVSTAVGLLAGPVLGAQLWQFVGPWGFTVTALLFLVSGAFFWVVRDADHVVMRSAQPRPPVLPRLVRILRRGDLLSFAPAWLAINAVVGLWGTHLIFQMRSGSIADTQYLTGFFDENFISVVLMVYGLTLSVGVIAWGFVLGRLGEARVMRFSLLGLLMLTLAVFGINHAAASPPVQWLLALVAAGALTIQSGFAPAAVTYLARLATRSSEDRGLFMGIYSVVLGLGQFAGQVLGGPFADRGGVDGILILTLLLGLVAAGTVLRLPAHIEHEAHEAQPSDVAVPLDVA